MIDSVLDHLWQSTIFTAFVGLITLAFRNNGAKIRHWLWFVASVKFLIPFTVLTALSGRFLTLFQPPVPAPILYLLEPVILPFSTALLAPSEAATPRPDLTALLLALWGLGFVTLAARWLVRWSRLRVVLRSAVDCSLAAPVTVKMAASSLEPGLIGILQPVILLPLGLSERLSSEEMEAILAHELCHWRRRDNLLADRVPQRGVTSLA